MGLYIFTCEQCGRSYERVADANKLPDNFRLGHANPCENGDCSGSAYRDLCGEIRDFRDTPGNWPMASNALAVHGSQVSEAIREADAAGVPTRFDAQHRPVFESNDHRNRYLRLRGAIDMDAGYGQESGGRRNVSREQSEPLVNE
jgi:hypothetical protein